MFLSRQNTLCFVSIDQRDTITMILINVVYFLTGIATNVLG